MIATNTFAMLSGLFAFAPHSLKNERSSPLIIWYIRRSLKAIELLKHEVTNSDHSADVCFDYFRYIRHLLRFQLFDFFFMILSSTLFSLIKAFNEILCIITKQSFVIEQGKSNDGMRYFFRFSWRMCLSCFSILCNWKFLSERLFCSVLKNPFVTCMVIKARPAPPPAYYILNDSEMITFSA